MRSLFRHAGLSLCVPFLLYALFSSCSLDIEFPERYALLYGVADYPGAANDLNYTDDDAAAMAALFTEKGFTSVKLFTDSTATFSSMQDEISQLNIPENSLFVFYYSGHGLKSGETEYIFPYDYETNGAVSDDQLGALLATVPCRKKVVIIDACNSGGFIGEGYSVDAYPDNWDGGSFYASSIADTIYNYLSVPSSSGIPYSEAVVLAAAGAEEFSYEGSDIMHGYFTYGLLEASGKGDADGDGYLSTLEMYKHARNFVTRYTFTITADPESGPYLPHISGGPVDFILFEAD